MARAPRIISDFADIGCARLATVHIIQCKRPPANPRDGPSDKSGRVSVINCHESYGIVRLIPVL